MLTKISKWSRIQDSCRITPKTESLVACVMPDILSEFQKDPSITFWVILLTHRQTNKQTNKKQQKHYLLGGDNKGACFYNMQSINLSFCPFYLQIQPFPFFIKCSRSIFALICKRCIDCMYARVFKTNIGAERWCERAIGFAASEDYGRERFVHCMTRFELHRIMQPSALCYSMQYYKLTMFSYFKPYLKIRFTLSCRNVYARCSSTVQTRREPQRSPGKQHSRETPLGRKFLIF